jgi:spore germination protein (amino acid permease)
MKQKVSNLQVILLVANLIFSSTVISLPQIVVQVSGQNAWLIPLLLLPFIILIIFLMFGKTRNAEQLTHLFSIERKKNVWETAFVIVFLFTISLVFLRDLRGAVDFIATVLLPGTPIDIMTVLSVLVVAYIATAGLEVVLRVNALHFVILAMVVVMLPLFLMNEFEYRNLQPLPSLKTVQRLLMGIMFAFSWVGEIVLSLIMVGSIHPIKQARKSMIIGAGLGILLFSLVLIVEIGVLGTKIVREATYPSFIMIQQINWTDFLDRLDPIIVVVWLPTILTKIAYLLYALNHCLSYLYKSNTNKFLLPISLIFAYLSILFFKNNMDHLHFSFYTWSSLGLVLEVLIMGMFFIVRKMAKKHRT